MQSVTVTDNSLIGKDLMLSKDADMIVNRTDNIEIVAQYIFNFGLQPSIAYLLSRAKNTDYGDIAVVKYFEVGANYKFKKT